MIRNNINPITIVPFLNSASDDKKNRHIKAVIKRHCSVPLPDVIDIHPANDIPDKTLLSETPPGIIVIDGGSNDLSIFQKKKKTLMVKKRKD